MKSAAINATRCEWYISNGNGFTKRISSAIDASYFSRKELLFTYKSKLPGRVSTDVVSSSEWTNVEDRDAKFMVACSPENVLELISKYEELLNSTPQ